MFRLDGKVALVTGGAGGVGRAIVTRLAEHGAHVIINCFHSYPAAKRLCGELTGRGLHAEVVRASVARQPQVQQMFRQITAGHGRLDILVNNAARGSFESALDTTSEHLDVALDVGLKGTLWCAQEAYPLLTAAGGGAIVNLSSIGANGMVGNYAGLGAAKAGIEALTRYLAVEFAAAGIRVNTASGGLIDGEVIDLFPRAAELRAQAIETTPLGRLGTPEELADVVFFLASDASRWVTGQCVIADGGQSIGGAMLTPPSLWRGGQRSATPAEPAAGPVADPVRSPRLAVAERDAAPGDGDERVVAVVGAGLAVPGASDLQEFWRVLDEGPELLSEARPDRFRGEAFYSADLMAEDKTYQTRCGYADDYRPRPWLAQELGADRRTTEYTTQWYRHAVSDALRSVRLPEASRCSCVLGYTPDGNQHLEEFMVIEGILDDLESTLRAQGETGRRRDELLRQARALLEDHYPLHRAPTAHLLPYEVVTRAVSGLLPHGTQLLTVDTACSSGIYAVDLGVKGILEGKHDLAVCGGSFAVGPRNAVLFAKLRGLSRSGRIRPFDRDGDGVLFADGAAAVALKRLDLARRDGDTILGYISAIGVSSDGGGKAIYAPNESGQRLAIQRALDKIGTQVRPDWIVAHGTGTPSGDHSEISSIRQALGDDSPLLITSNKALVGHTGWAAGAVSLVHALLSMERQTILPQHRFTEAREQLGLNSGGPRVPRERTPWPADDQRTRIAGVSGFGFGGTNAHMLVQDRPAQQQPPSRDSIVVVGWAANLPGFPGADAVRAWLTGAGPAPQHTFGPSYDRSRVPLRMPPKALRTLDRSQLMVVLCAEELRRSLGDVWDEHRATTGVFVGHMGPTRHATLYAKRCHLDNALAALGKLPGDLALEDSLLEAFRTTVRADVPASNEDSFPGSMPNMIPARVSNHFNLNGPNMTIDIGFGSTLGACEVAARYLLAGDVDIALVGGVNGNSTPVMARLAGRLSDLPGLRIGEGAFLFATMRKEAAAAAGLPVLAELGPLLLGDPEPAAVDRYRCGATERADEPSYLGADSAVAILRAICAQDAERAVVVAHENRELPPLSLPLRLPKPAQHAQPTTVTTEKLLLKRHVAHWQPASADPVRSSQPALPPDAVVLTATPDLLGDLGTRPGDPLVLSVVPTEGVNRRYLADLSPESVRLALGPDATRRHVRILTDLERLAAPDKALDGDCDLFFRLQDLSFLTVQALPTPPSVLGLFLGGWADRTLHPCAGLFSGFFKSLALELAESAVAAVFTTQTRLGPALAELETESAARQFLPVAVYRDGVRHTLETTQEDALPAGIQPLDPESVVVAVGGGYGITAELLKAVAERYRPIIYTISSTELPEHGGEAGSLNGDGPGDRAAFIRRELAQHPGQSVREANQRFNALEHAFQIRRNLHEMERLCGHRRVRHLQADILDPAQLQRALDQVFDQHPRIDLLIHAAGVNRAGALAGKPLAHFRQVRDVKVKGYLHLRSALRGRLPRSWCSFASLIALTGQLGETDYAAANDFLGTAAAYQRHVEGRDEFAIGWTLWKDVGMAASSIHKSFFTGVMGDVLTLMPPAEGSHHFLAELQAANRAAATYLLGQTERAAIERILPGYFATRKTRGTFYLGRIVHRDRDQLVVERQFSADSDGYLCGHAVRGIATLPGCFVTELIAEAAQHLIPDLSVVGFRDITFHRFLKLLGVTERSPRRIVATVRRREPGQALVEVTVLGDVVAPNGMTLTRDKQHFSGMVVLADAYPPAPRRAPWPPAPESPIVDPYHVPGGPAYLTGPFVTSENLRQHPLGKRARYTGPVQPGSVWDDFLVPVLLLDGLARLSVLELVDDRYVPVAAPTRIRRIDLHGPDNDVDLGRRADGPIELSVTPRGLPFDGGAYGHFTATLPDGRVLVQMKDVRGLLLGYLDTVTGRHVDPAELDSASLSLADPGAVPL